jgi:CRISPR/Cas system-associated protein Cas10 (large subunit of type III CRISPR-Cas system)
MEKIIVWDFSGIQGYLYNIQKNKSATKRLKWRSTFIEILLEKIKDDLKEKLWKQNFIDEKWNRWKDYIINWGKFILICDKFDQNKFDDFKKDLEEKLLIQFYGELKIIFWISDYIENDFKNSLNKAFENLEKNKNKAFSSVFTKDWKWNSNEFVIEEKNEKWENIRWTDSVCGFSRWDLKSVKKWFDRYIDDILNDEWLDAIWQNTANDIIISNFIAWNEWWKKEVIIFENEKIKLEEKYKKYLPRFQNDEELKEYNKNKSEKEKARKNDLKSFEGIAWKDNFNKLACLKWDIDDLWKLFMFWLNEDNYKENYKILSEKLDDFWNKTLYEIIWNKNIYTVYAGWDDFLILWKWDEIIEFYIELKEAFKKFVISEEIMNLLKDKTKIITFSWAINLFWPHDTFFTVVKQTDNLLDEAKNKSSYKNNINIFWKVISNWDFKKLFEEIKEFEKKYELYENEKSIVSTWTLRFLLDIAKKIILDENKWVDENWNQKDFFEYGLWKAELFYMLWRNYNIKKDKLNEQEKLKNEFWIYINWMILHNYVDINNDWIYKSLSWNNDLFKEKVIKKLFVMMSYILYKLRS